MYFGFFYEISTAVLYLKLRYQISVYEYQCNVEGRNYRNYSWLPPIFTSVFLHISILKLHMRYLDLHVLHWFILFHTIF